MSEPQTPTGKALASTNITYHHSTHRLLNGKRLGDITATIEAEAAAMERERLAADLALAAKARSPDAHLFTVDSLAAAVFAADDPHFRFATRGNCERFAAAIIEAVKEASE